MDLSGEVTTKKDGYPATSASDLAWANPLSDSYDPAALNEPDRGYVTSSSKLSWSGFFPSATLAMPDGHGASVQFSLKIVEHS